MEHTSKLKIDFSFAILIFLSIVFDFWENVLTAYAIMFLHESAHIFAARVLGLRLKKISLMAFGVTAELEKEPETLRDEIIIASAGPLLNVVMLVFGLFYQNNFLIIINSGLLIINIIPIIPLDGGRILQAILGIKWGIVKAYNRTKTVSKLALIALSIFSVCFLILNYNFSFIIITSFLIVNYINENKNSTFILLKKGILLENKIKNFPSKIEILAVSPEVLVCKVLKHFSKNYFYIVKIIDANGKIIKTITENEIIKTLQRDGIRTRFGRT